MNAFLEPKALIDIRCQQTNSESPAELECVARNTGDRAAHAVFVRFSRFLPDGTHIASNAKEPLQILPIGEPIEPANAMFSPSFVAYSVVIPVIEANSEISFRIFTNHRDNKRAAAQVVRISDERQRLVQEIIDKLKQNGKEIVPPFDMGAFRSGELKNRNFYAPKEMRFGETTVDLNYLSKSELRAKAVVDFLFSTAAATINLTLPTTTYKGPVVVGTVGTTPVTVAMLTGAYPSIEITFEPIRGRDAVEQGERSAIPAIPKRYTDTDVSAEYLRWMEYGENNLIAKNFTEAETAFRRASELEPDLKEPKIRLSKLLGRKRRRTTVE